MAYTLNYFWINNDTGFVVSGFTDSDPSNPTTVIDIPATHTGLNESGETITRPVIGIIGGAEDTPYGLFKDNTNITKVNLPESMLFIYAETFMGCTNLTSITLPKFQSPDENNPSFIGADAFTNSGLTTIYYTGTVEQWNNISIDPTAIPSTVRKYLLKTSVIKLPEGSELIKSTENKDLVSTYAIKDVKGNQIDTTYIPRTEFDNLVNIANGLGKTYVATIGDTINTQFNSDEDTISINQFISTDGTTILASQLEVGDSILITNMGIPDRWVISKAGEGDAASAVLGPLETNKIIGITAVEKDISASDATKSVYKIRLSNNNLIDGFTVTNGVNGANGADGTNGADGAPGAAGGFGTPTASVTASTGTPTVYVSASGPDTAKVFNFAFSGLKGEKGDPGQTITYNASSKILTIKG